MGESNDKKEMSLEDLEALKKDDKGSGDSGNSNDVRFPNL